MANDGIRANSNMQQNHDTLQKYERINKGIRVKINIMNNQRRYLSIKIDTNLA